MNHSLGDSLVLAMIRSGHEDKKHVFSLGIYDYISTPVIPSEVQVRIRSCFYHHQQILTGSTIPALNQAKNAVTAFGTNQSVVLEIGDRDTDLVRKACHYLSVNVAENYSLDKLASTMVTNRNSLSQAFKKVMGQGVFSWLRQERMQKAEHLLTTTDLTIQQICFEVGYHVPANFSTTFKRYFSMSPQQYRRKMMPSK